VNCQDRGLAGSPVASSIDVCFRPFRSSFARRPFGKMDTPISGERINEERAFIKRYTEGLSGHKVEYPADFSTPLEDRPRKVNVIEVSQAMTWETQCSTEVRCQ